MVGWFIELRSGNFEKRGKYCKMTIAPIGEDMGSSIICSELPDDMEDR